MYAPTFQDDYRKNVFINYYHNMLNCSMIPATLVSDCNKALHDASEDKFKTFNFGDLGVSPEIEEYALKYAK